MVLTPKKSLMGLMGMSTRCVFTIVLFRLRRSEGWRPARNHHKFTPQHLFTQTICPSKAVLGAIKHSILTGELRPGQPLVETELAERLGVSKTPVREALKTLAGSGLVVMLPYKGTTVRAKIPLHADSQVR